MVSPNIPADSILSKINRSDNSGIINSTVSDRKIHTFRSIDGPLPGINMGEVCLDIVNGKMYYVIDTEGTLQEVIQDNNVAIPTPPPSIELDNEDIDRYKLIEDRNKERNKRSGISKTELTLILLGGGSLTGILAYLITLL